MKRWSFKAILYPSSVELMPKPLHYLSPQTDPPGVVYPYFCPATGRSLCLRHCRRNGENLGSPCADMAVQLSGWAMLAGAFIAFGCGYLYTGGLQQSHGNMGAVELTGAGTLAFVCVAILRFGRQWRALRKDRESF